MTVHPCLFEEIILPMAIPHKTGKHYTQAFKIVYPPDANVIYLDGVYDEAQLWLPFNSFIILTARQLIHSHLYVDGSSFAYKELWARENKKSAKAKARRPSADNRAFEDSKKKYTRTMDCKYHEFECMDDFKQLTLPFPFMRRIVIGFDIRDFVADPNGPHEIIKFKTHERAYLPWLEANCVGRYYVYDNYGHHHAIYFENSNDAAWFKLENDIKAKAEITRYSVIK